MYAVGFVMAPLHRLARLMNRGLLSLALCTSHRVTVHRGNRGGGSASALRDEVLRLRDTVKAEQAAAHRELHNTRAAVQPAG